MQVLEPLTATECWTLLGEHDRGRVAFTERALPSIALVAYTVTDSHLVLRCASEREAAQLDGQVVALQVDDVDAATGASRSVIVTGTTESVDPSASPRGQSTAKASLELHAGSVRGLRSIPAA